MMLNYLTLCHYGGSTGSNISLAGLFNRITAKDFPHNYGRVFIAFEVLKMHPGDAGVFRLEMSTPSGETMVEFEQKYTISENSQGISAVVQIPNLVLPATGKYEMRVLINGDEVGVRELDVNPI